MGPQLPVAHNNKQRESDECWPASKSEVEKGQALTCGSQNQKSCWNLLEGCPALPEESHQPTAPRATAGAPRPRPEGVAEDTMADQWIHGHHWPYHAHLYHDMVPSMHEAGKGTVCCYAATSIATLLH